MPDRTTIVMPPDLKERAVRKAREKKISFGEFIRQAVESYLTSPLLGVGQKSGDPFLDNLVTFDDGGPTDMSVNHDKYLYEALEIELRRHGHFSSPPSPASQRRRQPVANARKTRTYKQSGSRRAG
jgi:hypothetical protein